MTATKRKPATGRPAGRPRGSVDREKPKRYREFRAALIRGNIKLADWARIEAGVGPAHVRLVLTGVRRSPRIEKLADDVISQYLGVA
jgi:hypothetical protein